MSYAKKKNKKTKKHYKCGTSFGIGRQHKLKGSEERVYRGWKCGEKLVIGGLRKGDPWKVLAQYLAALYLQQGDR